MKGQKFALETRPAQANTLVTVIDMQGELDGQVSDFFEQTLLDLFKKGKYKLVLNLEKLTYVSSAGFGVLMSLIKNVRKKHGDIKVTNVRPEVYSLFELLDLPGLFHILKSESEAVRNFQ